MSIPNLKGYHTKKFETRRSLNLTKRTFSSLDKIDQSPKIDPLSGGRMPVYIEAVRRLKKYYGDSVVVRAPGTSDREL